MEIIPLPTPQDFKSIFPLFLACSVDVEKSYVILVLDSLNISEWEIFSILGPVTWWPFLPRNSCFESLLQ